MKNSTLEVDGVGVSVDEVDGGRGGRGGNKRLRLISNNNVKHATLYTKPRGTVRLLVMS